MKTKIYILLISLSIITISIFLWWNQAKKPANPEDKTFIPFTVQKGENSRSIADRLQKQNLLRSPVAFFLIARFGGLANNIQAGEFSLSPSMNLYTLADKLTHGTEDVRVTIIEGWRNEEIALKLAKELNIPENEFLKFAKIGYMFPDTYQIPKDSTAETVSKLFIKNFNSKITQEIINSAKIKNLNLEELITIASLVEREAKNDQDRPLVASVILNRLKIGMKLDIDATIQYALGYQTNDKTWWKKELTEEDLNIDSPFNTYKNQGLPPSPISNPGFAVIKAVINAPTTDYIYYLSDDQGKTYFSRTLDEHNTKIIKYLEH
jgi:UPF0755 protein